MAEVDIAQQEQFGRPRVHVVNGPSALCAQIEQVYDLRRHDRLDTVVFGFEVVLIADAGLAGPADSELNGWLAEHQGLVCIRITDTSGHDNAGFFDEIAPDVELSRMCRQIERAHERTRLLRVEQARFMAVGHSVGLALVGPSPAAESLRKSVRSLARGSSPILLVGELGTGKEDVSHALHIASRPASPFVRVSATPKHERPCFGHKSWDLAVEQTARGTLLIDDATRLSDRTQAVILRALRKGVSCRVVFASRPSLPGGTIQPSSEGFGARFAAKRLILPTLRSRGDVQILSQHLLKSLSAALHRGARKLAPAVELALEEYAFPGNLRELRVMIELALLVGCREELTLAEFPILARAVRQVRARRPSPKARSLRGIRAGAAADEKSRVEEALVLADGNVSAAARTLKLSRYQLIRRLHKYGLR